jgi:hypothetical protein
VVCITHQLSRNSSVGIGTRLGTGQSGNQDLILGGVKILFWTVAELIHMKVTIYVSLNGARVAQISEVLREWTNAGR